MTLGVPTQPRRDSKDSKVSKDSGDVATALLARQTRIGAASDSPARAGRDSKLGSQRLDSEVSDARRGFDKLMSRLDGQGIAGLSAADKQRLFRDIVAWQAGQPALDTDLCERLQCTLEQLVDHDSADDTGHLLGRAVQQFQADQWPASELVQFIQLLMNKTRMPTAMVSISIAALVRAAVGQLRMNKHEGHLDYIACCALASAGDERRANAAIAALKEYTGGTQAMREQVLRGADAWQAKDAWLLIGTRAPSTLNEPTKDDPDSRTPQRVFTDAELQLVRHAQQILCS